MDFSPCSAANAYPYLKDIALLLYRYAFDALWPITVIIGLLTIVAVKLPPVRRPLLWVSVASIAFALFAFLVSDYMLVCLHGSHAPYMDYLVRIHLSIYLIALLFAFASLRAFGPSIERLLEWLTGRSRERGDTLSDIRHVDAEIPECPDDVDPRDYVGESKDE